MKGHMKDGKFHPHTEYKKGTRKSRDLNEKTTGVRLQRNKKFNPFITTQEAKKFSDADIERKITIHRNALSQQSLWLSQGHGFDKDENDATLNALNVLVSERANRNTKNRKARAEGSTAFGGMGLFDIANKIGKWEGQMGYRGMMEVWVHKKTGDTIVVENYEDTPEERMGKDFEGEDEVWVHDKESGKHDTLFIGSPDESIAFANDWMRENKDGWT